MLLGKSVFFLLFLWVKNILMWLRLYRFTPCALFRDICLHVTFIDDEKYFHFDPFLHPQLGEKNLLQEELKSNSWQCYAWSWRAFDGYALFSSECRSFFSCNNKTYEKQQHYLLHERTDNRGASLWTQTPWKNVKTFSFNYITKHWHKRELNQQNVNLPLLCWWCIQLRRSRRRKNFRFWRILSVGFRGKFFGCFVSYVTDLLHCT